MTEQSAAYVWEVPGKPVRVRISFEVMDRIAAEAERGMRATAPPGVEVGGVLLGTVVPGDEHEISIHAVEPIRCEYAYGATFILTERDEQRLSAELNRRRVEVSGAQPVGFFRSHTRPELTLSEQDLWLFATHFSSPHNVALIVKPRSGRPPVGGFFFWENGTIKSDGSYKEFLLDSQELGARPARAGIQREGTTGAAGSIAPGGERLPAPSFGTSLGSAAAEPKLRRVRIPSLANAGALATLAAALMLAGGLLGFVAGRLWRPAPPPPPARDPYSLSLSVAEYGGNLHLKWDRTAPAITHGRRGLLSITDGDAAKPPIELGPEQLRKGSVIYRRLTPNVKMRLEVFVNGRDSVAEVWEPGPR